MDDVLVVCGAEPIHRRAHASAVSDHVGFLKDHGLHQHALVEERARSALAHARIDVGNVGHVDVGFGRAHDRVQADKVAWFERELVKDTGLLRDDKERFPWNAMRRVNVDKLAVVQTSIDSWNGTNVVVDQIRSEKERRHCNVVGGRVRRRVVLNVRLVGQVLVRKASACRWPARSVGTADVSLVESGSEIHLNHFHVVVVQAIAKGGAHVAPVRDRRLSRDGVGQPLVPRDKVLWPPVRPVPHVGGNRIGAQYESRYVLRALLKPGDQMRRVRLVGWRVDVPDNTRVFSGHPNVPRTKDAAPTREHRMCHVHYGRRNDAGGARTECQVAPSRLRSALV